MAARFWVGGTGTWDNSTTTHWSATTGGAGGAAVPVPGDNVTLDGASGGGTVTVAATINSGPNSIGSLATGAFTGTLDFSVNNPSITISGAAGFSISGIGSGRVYHLGSGTFLLNSTTTPWTATTTTGLTTFDAGTSTLEFTASNGLAINFGGLTYATVKIDSPSPRGSFSLSGANTFSNLVLVAPSCVMFPNAVTNAVTTLTLSGASAANPIGIMSSSTTAQASLNITNAIVFDSCAVRGISFAGAASPFTATNSYDLGQNTNLTVTGPSSGGAHMIGG